MFSAGSRGEGSDQGASPRKSTTHLKSTQRCAESGSRSKVVTSVDLGTARARSASFSGHVTATLRSRDHAGGGEGSHQRSSSGKSRFQRGGRYPTVSKPL